MIIKFTETLHSDIHEKKKPNKRKLSLFNVTHTDPRSTSLNLSVSAPQSFKFSFVCFNPLYTVSKDSNHGYK